MTISRSSETRGMTAEELTRRAAYVEELLDAVVEGIGLHYVTRSSIVGPGQDATLVRARKIAYWKLSREGFSAGEIMDVFRRSHSNVSRGIRHAERDRAAADPFARMLAALPSLETSIRARMAGDHA